MNRIVAAIALVFLLGFGSGYFARSKFIETDSVLESPVNGEQAFADFLSSWNVLQFMEAEKLDLAKVNLRISLEGNLVHALKNGTPAIDAANIDGKNRAIKSYLEYWNHSQKIDYGDDDPINPILENTYRHYLQEKSD